MAKMTWVVNRFPRALFPSASGGNQAAHHVTLARHDLLFGLS
jgi:hypothetical protein